MSAAAARLALIVDVLVPNGKYQHCIYTVLSKSD